jgi:Family of unknown function (DUF5996)
MGPARAASSRQPLQTSHRRARVGLLIVQVLQKVPVELLEALDHALARSSRVGARQGLGGLLDGVQEVRDASVICLEAIDDRPHGLVNGPQRGEQEDVLGSVVRVDEAAVPQAVDLQLPQRPGGLQLTERVLNRRAGEPVRGVGGELLDDLEVATDDRVNPQQLLEQGLATVGLGYLIEVGHDRSGGRLCCLVTLLNIVSPAWPPLTYESWSATCDTVHAHTQLLGKLAVRLAPPEPQLQHAALRLTARGWETQALPAPDGSGSIAAALDLRSHEAVVEHSGGRETRIALTPDRSVAEVTREVLEAASRLGGPVEINPTPQETPWTTPLDQDEEHATYDPDAVAVYFGAATQAALALAEFRAPFRGRSTPVNAWWGTFDLAVSFFSGQPADPPSDDFIMRNGGDAQQIAVGWWPGDPKRDGAAFFSYAYPSREGFEDADLSPQEARWEPELGEYVLDWEDVRSSPDPRALVLEFARSAFRHACEVCDWDPALAATAEGVPPPLR